MVTPPADLDARVRAYRDEAQARLDAGPLGRRGTVNRALSEWVRVGGHEFLLPEPSPRPSAEPGTP